MVTSDHDFKGFFIATVKIFLITLLSDPHQCKNHHFQALQAYIISRSRFT